MKKHLFFPGLFFVILTIMTTNGYSQDLEEYCNIAYKKFMNKDYQGAIDEYTKVIKIDSLYARAYKGRGKAKCSLKDYQGAIADFSKSVELNPGYAVYKDVEKTKEILNPTRNDSTFIDSRDGRVYKIVIIGDQVWMAENLNYDSEILKKDGSVLNDWCEQCDKYGRLYCWDAAIVVCPKGWHLPTMDEWDILFNHIGGKNSRVGCSLKSTSGWKKTDKCETNSSGFTALPGGHVFRGKIRLVGEVGYWWMDTRAQSYLGASWYAGLSYSNERIMIDIFAKTIGNSVRCVRDK